MSVLRNQENSGLPQRAGVLYTGVGKDSLEWSRPARLLCCGARRSIHRYEGTDTILDFLYSRIPLLSGTFQEDDGIHEIILGQVQIQNGYSEHSVRNFNAIPVAVMRVVAGGCPCAARAVKATEWHSESEDTGDQIRRSLGPRDHRSQQHITETIPGLVICLGRIRLDRDADACHARSRSRNGRRQCSGDDQPAYSTQPTCDGCSRSMALKCNWLRPPCMFRSEPRQCPIADYHHAIPSARCPP